MKVLALVCMLMFAVAGWAQDSTDDWPEDLLNDEWAVEASLWSHSGFIELAWGERIDDDVLFADQSTLSELRWHQAFDYSTEQFDFNWSYDVWFDAVPNSDDAGLQFDLRELNFKFSLFDQTDVVLGRQITTWGTGDLLFINDLFPKDWVSFFSGRDDNYLKVPADALRLSSFFSAFNVDLVITPTAEPDRFINGERFSLFSPFAQSNIGGFEAINPRNPNQAEYALRLFKNINSHQLALYGYHGIEKSPTGVDNSLQAYFPKKNVWGASFQSTLGKGLYSLELGYHDVLDDKHGTNPLVANSQWRALLGYERELIKKLNWGVQYYLEHTEHYDRLLDNSMFPLTEPEENRQVITNRLTYMAKQDKLTWSLFVFYSPTDEDSYWRPSVNYRHNDQWQLTMGAQVFTSKKPHTFFAQFEDSSSVYSRIRYQF
ncbi:hypothetical protein MNBD_GAMMA02-1136 [hydrothermal vent metagenome]|uniref:Uncharacterized protein n=1 Tax=hydrothermal vent metagenome TaxID=652676 RepID=A0A3B0VM14_9ZZZZ